MYVSYSNPKKINIVKSSDIFNRYKMTQIQIVITGKDHNVRTTFTNLNDVAKQLHTKPEYITQYIAYKKSAKTGIVNNICYVGG